MVGRGLVIRRHVLCGGLGKDVTVVCGMERAMGNRIGHVWRLFLCSFGSRVWRLCVLEHGMCVVVVTVFRLLGIGCTRARGYARRPGLQDASVSRRARMNATMGACVNVQPQQSRLFF